jgi:hypothetical protein
MDGNAIWKKLRHRLWQAAHLHLYPAEIRAFIWTESARMRIWFGRRMGYRTLLFHITNTGQQPYIEPVLRELQRRQAKITCFLACGRAVQKALAGKCSIPARNMHELNVCRQIRGFDAVVTPTLWSEVRSLAPVRICIFHGQPTKGNSFPPERMDVFNHFFLLGPLHRSLYEKTIAGHPEWSQGIQTHDIGYSKSDDLMANRFDRARILGGLGLDANKPTLLFAPAFDPGTSLDLYGESLFDELARLDANILVKLHPVNYERPLAAQHSKGIFWPDVLVKYEKRANFRHVGNQPLDPFMAASDLLLTDVSGAALEFMLLDRPVIFIDCPDFFGKTLCGNQYYPQKGDEVMQDIHANAGRGAGIVVRKLAELPAAVRESLEHPEEYSEARRRIRDVLLYNPGHAAEAAATKIMELLGQVPE